MAGLARRVSRSRPLRLLIAVFLAVPVLLTQTGTAHAGSLTDSIQVDIDMGVVPPTVTCSTSLAVQGEGSAATLAVGGGWCWQNNVPLLGFCDAGADLPCNRFGLAYLGVDQGGSACGFEDDWPVVEEQHTLARNKLLMGDVTFALGGCEPSTVCVRIWHDDNAPREGCVSVDLDVPPDSTAECEYGSWVARASAEVGSVVGVGSTWRVKKHYGEILLDGKVKAGRWFPYYVMANPIFVGQGEGYPNVLAADYTSGGETTPPATAGWGSIRYFSSGTAPGLWGNGSTLHPFARYAEAIDLGDNPALLTDPASVMVHQYPVNGHDEYWIKGDPAAPTEQRETDHEWQIVGVGIYDRNKGPLTGTWEPYLPSMDSRGALARNDPGSCAFYWGQKVWDDPTTTTDDPAGPMAPMPGDEDPAPDPEPPAPEDPGPETDFGALLLILNVLRAIFTAIGKLVGAVAALAGEIVDGVMGALKGLFIPDADVLSGFGDDMTEMVDESDVGDWRTLIGGTFNGGSPEALTVGQSSAVAPDFGDGCKGPGITWEKFSGVLDSNTIYPFDACDGTSATMAGYSRTILSVIVGAGGAMKVFEMVMVGIGAARNTRILAGHDWSGAVYTRGGQ